MAKAPRPGAGRRAEEQKESKRLARITLRGETLTLAVGNLPMGEKLAVRAATKRPYEDFLSPIGEDTFCVWWWLARRAHGEPLLSYWEVANEWPDDLDISPSSTEIEFEMVDPEITDDDPEA